MTNSHESQNTEFKSSWHDDYLKWICGFANAIGGMIYIGIEDNRIIGGLLDCAKLREKLLHFNLPRYVRVRNEDNYCHKLYIVIRLLINISLQRMPRQYLLNTGGNIAKTNI